MRASRRRFLRGAVGGAAVSVALPALDCWLHGGGRAWADGSAFPRRFGLYWWANGMLPWDWIPAQTGADWTPTALQASLTPIQHKVTLVTGTALRIPNRVPHFSGAAGLLSGVPELTVGDDSTFAAPSIDQVIAAAIGGATRYRSLEFGAAPGPGLSFIAANTRNAPESDPALLFDRVFGPAFVAPGEDPIVDPTLPLRRSVLDAVTEDLRDLKRGVGAADAIRLDQHLTGIRELEIRIARLQEAPPDLASCRRADPPQTEFPDIEGRPQLSARNRVLVDLAALAMACDLTRVFSNYFTYPVSNNLFPGAGDGHHNLTHDEPGDQPQVHTITEQCVAEYAYLLQALDAIPEGDGTLLDHCAVLGTSEVSLGRTHALDEFPLLVGGGLDGRLRMGLHLRSETVENTGKVLLSLLRAVGVARADWGEGDSRTEDGFSALEA